MIKIGLLSDTHAWWDDRYVTYFSGCDEIWHAGDIGSETLALQLASIKPPGGAWKYRRISASYTIPPGASV